MQNNGPKAIVLNASGSIRAAFTRPLSGICFSLFCILGSCYVTIKATKYMYIFFPGITHQPSLVLSMGTKPARERTLIWPASLARAFKSAALQLQSVLKPGNRGLSGKFTTLRAGNKLILSPQKT